jgi:general secretion pathway protein C
MKHIFRLIDLLALAACVYFGVQAYRTLTAPAPQALPARTAGQTARQGERPPTPGVPAPAAPILQRDLFRTRAAAAEELEPLRVDELEKTQLHLRLWGTVVQDEAPPYAVIEDLKKRQQDLYRIGDSVQGGVIQHILREKVVLNVDGKDQVLLMEELFSQAGGDEPQPVRPGQPPAAAMPPGQTEASGEEEGPAVLQVAITPGLLQEAAENPGELLREVQVRPHFSEGRIDGVSLTGIRPNSVLRKLGLRNGDVVTGMDGEQIQSVEGIVDRFGGLDDRSEMEIRIRRRGKDQIIEYSLP